MAIKAGRVPRPIKFVKMDVEGWEASVIDGMAQILEQDRPCLTLEGNPRTLKLAGIETVDLFRRLVAHRYGIFRISRRPGFLSLRQFELSAIDPNRALASVRSWQCRRHGWLTSDWRNPKSSRQRGAAGGN